MKKTLILVMATLCSASMLLSSCGGRSNSPDGGSSASTEIKEIVISPSEVNLYVGELTNLKYTISPTEAAYNEIVWQSSNESVATVNRGTVRAVGEGTANITATASKGGAKSNVVTINVEIKKYPVESVALNKSTLEIEVEESETLVATIAPENAYNKEVTWSSSDTSVATVDATGKVTGVAEGTATITVTTVDGGKTATCAVTINPKTIRVSSVSLSETTKTIREGQSFKLVATVAPADAKDKSVTWSSSNTAVATVDNDGNVTAVAEGTAVITVTTTDGSKTATCTVTVEKKPDGASIVDIPGEDF